MSPHRQVLLGVLRAAAEPCSNERMGTIIDELRAHKFSVYAPSNICTMLETAGALERVTADGSPYAALSLAPDVVVEDGVEFYVPATPPTVFWRTSEAGAEMLEANDPTERVVRQLEREAEFAVLYKRVLVLAARDEGATMAQLSGAVDSDPLIAEPRRFFVQHFAEALERCECIAWRGDAWHATDTGRAVLESQLADVEDATPETVVEPAAMPTETQGVNW